MEALDGMGRGGIEEGRVWRGLIGSFISSLFPEKEIEIIQNP